MEQRELIADRNGTDAQRLVYWAKWIGRPEMRAAASEVVDLMKRVAGKLHKGCTHVNGDFHLFEIGQGNPLDPKCSRCGKSIGQLLGIFAPKQRKR